MTGQGHGSNASSLHPQRQNQVVFHADPVEGHEVLDVFMNK